MTLLAPPTLAQVAGTHAGSAARRRNGLWRTLAVGALNAGNTRRASSFDTRTGRERSQRAPSSFGSRRLAQTPVDGILRTEPCVKFDASSILNNLELFNFEVARPAGRPGITRGAHECQHVPHIATEILERAVQGPSATSASRKHRGRAARPSPACPGEAGRTNHRSPRALRWPVP